MYGILGHLAGASGHGSGKIGHQYQTDHNNDHLEEVGQGHRPHTAENRINQNHNRADDHCIADRNIAFRQKMNDESERSYLSSNPAEVRENNEDRTAELNRNSVAASVKVTDGQQTHSIQFSGEKHTDEDKRHT